MVKNEYYMKMALQLAREAAATDEVPIGALVVLNGSVIGKGYNQTERLNDATAHAEILALTAAMNHTGSKYLKECTLFVTLEPCHMCAGALYWAKIGAVVFGASDPKQGFLRFGSHLLHPKTRLEGNCLEIESLELIKEFFLNKRK